MFSSSAQAPPVQRRRSTLRGQEPASCSRIAPGSRATSRAGAGSLAARSGMPPATYRLWLSTSLTGWCCASGLEGGYAEEDIACYFRLIIGACLVLIRHLL